MHMKNDSLFAKSQITALTPMMQQYLGVKSQYQDCLLCFRLGDFYELFFEDAKIASSILEIVLTSRGKNSDDAIPMCGLPYHSADLYWAKLVKAGYKLAICEQLELPSDAKKRGNKEIVRREVVRVITAGTLVEDTMIVNKQNQYIISLFCHNSTVAISYADVTTGDCYVDAIPISMLGSVIASVRPKEILLSEKTYIIPEIKGILSEYKDIISFRLETLFSVVKCTNTIKKFYAVYSLDSFLKMDEMEVIAIGVLLDYIQYAHKEKVPHLKKPLKVSSSNFLEIDPSTIKNLELFHSFDEKKGNSVFALLNFTVTSMGSRLYYHHASFILKDPQSIESRLDIVEFFYKNPSLLKEIRHMLGMTSDLQKLMMKFSIDRANFIDCLSLLQTLSLITDITNTLNVVPGLLIPSGLSAILAQIGNYGDLLSFLQQAILPIDSKNCPNNGSEILNRMYWSDLAKLYDVRDNASKLIQDLQDEYKAKTGVNNIKILKNNVIGYFIEVTAVNLHKIKNEMNFLLKQTMQGYSRFTSIELNELANQIENCLLEIEAREREVMSIIASKILAYSGVIYNTANSIACIDVYCSSAFCAHENGYNRPIIDDGLDIKITNGRHPIVEKVLDLDFVSNDCVMTQQENLWLITGPNMAGKSTFLRQTAIIILLAQMGCFVPADGAKIGVVDKVFSRIGASDNIASGYSTFMVEMVETAYILNHATARSFLILDEVGRGTSTEDGLAIATAVIENIHDKVMARCIFATHYHELIHLSSELKRLRCYTLKVSHAGDTLVLLHKVIEGALDKSFGIYVAKMAGIPNDVILRAKALLCIQKEENEAINISNCQHNIANNNRHHDETELDLIHELKDVNLDDLTPKMAIDLLYNWKKRVYDVS